MRLVFLLFVACGLGACAAPRPAAPPAPLPRVVLPPAQPVPPLAEPAVPLPPPAAPARPPVPRESIERRSSYPGAGLVEWELHNGLRVVLLDQPGTDGPPVAVAVAPGGYATVADSAGAQAAWAALRQPPAGVRASLGGTSRWVATEGAPEPAFSRLAAVFLDRASGPPTLPTAAALLDGAVVPGAPASPVGSPFAEAPAFVVVVVGPADLDEVEAWAGTLLAPLRAVSPTGQRSARPPRLPDGPLVWAWPAAPSGLDVLFRARLDAEVDPIAYDLLAAALQSEVGFGDVVAIVSRETATVDLHVRAERVAGSAREALDRVLATAARLAASPEAAVRRARESLGSTDPDGRALRARWIADAFLRGLDPRDLQRREAALRDLDPRAVRQAAAVLFRPDRLAAVLGSPD